MLNLKIAILFRKYFSFNSNCYYEENELAIYVPPSRVLTEIFVQFID
jgi:hypothetical protein